MINLFEPSNREFVYVDDWIMRKEDMIVNTIKGWMNIPLSKLLKLKDKDCEYLDRFSLSTKKSYNSPKLRDIASKYINYFLKYYDTDKELIYIYYKLKISMDCYTIYYTDDAFINDLCKYFLSPSIHFKINEMNSDNYRVKLALPRDNIRDVLKYTDKHGRLLLKLSLIFKLIMPLVTHYMYKKKVAKEHIRDFLLKIYDNIIKYFGDDMDIYNKLYESALSLVDNSAYRNPIWEKQGIRGIDKTTFALDAVKSIVIDIIIQYVYVGNIVIFNYSTIKLTIGHQVTHGKYECDYIPLSSVPDKNTSDDNSATSQFDRFEDTLIKENEALYIQNKVNCEETMRMLTSKYPISNDEIQFYTKRLKNGNKFIINKFQLNLIFLLFDNVFGDTVSINAINREDYIKLIIISRRILLNNGLKLLPYIISGKIIKMVERKDVTAKQKKKIESGELWPLIQNKYKNNKIEEIVRSIIGTILATQFEYIEYNNKNIDGLKIDMIEDLIIEEVKLYVALI